MWALMLLLVCGIVNGQPPPGPLEMGEVAANMEKFGQLYGMATQIMSLGTQFMGTGSGASSGSRSDYGGNSILGEVARPTFRGVPTFGGESKSSSMGSLYNSEYGGLPSGGKPTGGIQSLLNTFLGSSVSGDGESLPPPPTPKPRAQSRSIMDLFGMGATDPPTTTQPPPPRQPNLLELFGLAPQTTPAPTTTTTRRATILDLFGIGRQSAAGVAESPKQEQHRQRNLLDFFGSSLSEDPYATRPRRQRNILDAFLGAGSPPAEEKPRARQAPIVNMLEMFGLMETTTTTERPRLFDSRSGFGMGKKGTSDIDGILNALMRGGARPTQPEQSGTAGILSEFFGKK